jgi:hypothetical protein
MMMRAARENATFAIVDIAGSDCAAGVFAICNPTIDTRSMSLQVIEIG